MGLLAAGTAVFLSYLPSFRFEEMLNAVVQDEGALQNVGTFAWRLGIYEDIFDQLAKRTAPQLLFGSGTSSGAALMLNHEPDKYDKQAIDANRVLHSEYLRALYEWGILGLALLLAFLFAATLALARKAKAEGGGPALAFFGLLPSIVVGLAIENVLAGASDGAGVGILLVMAFAWQCEPVWLTEPLAEDGFDSEDSIVPA
jgi:O-antigen ligase